MRFNNAKAISSGNATLTLHSSPIDTAFSLKGSFQAIFSANNSGALTIEASNEAVAPSHWSQISSTTVTGASLAIVAPIDLCYRWIRVSWAPSAGSGTLNVDCELIGF